jgi:hypothetical protein
MPRRRLRWRQAPGRTWNGSTWNGSTWNGSRTAAAGFGAKMWGVIDRSPFEVVADAMRGLVPADLGLLRCTHHRFGIKVWLGPDKPPREHYEAQVISPEHAPDASVLALEVGFHSEYPIEADNEAVISGLLRSEPAWRRQLGGEPIVGPFLGRAEHWRRVSEIWPDPDLDDPEFVFELAARLTEYLTTLELYRPGEIATPRSPMARRPPAGGAAAGATTGQSVERRPPPG